MTKKNEYFPQSRPHPGVTLLEKLEEMGLSVQEFAEYTGEPEKVIHAVLNGNGTITDHLAVKFETVTQIPAHFWLNSQRNYDSFLNRKKYQQVFSFSQETELVENE
jgi:addiction module HigA family antidote